MKAKTVGSSERGITLIVLVVTIVIIMIFATISINGILGENGLIAMSKETKERQLNAVEKKEDRLNTLMSEYENGTSSGSGTEESEEEGVQVTIGGKTVTLTEKNFGDYLGKIVTNYKAEGGTETVKVKTANYNGRTDFTVSTTYRLYYIDFNNKYGEGKGTVYLKADCTQDQAHLSDKKTANEEIIKSLNPDLYKEGVTAPASTHLNMKAVTWLLDKDEWNELKTSGASTEIGSKVNYVVGAPSVEMMMDSYNTHYKLTGDTPDITEIPESPDTTRKKLFYKYTSGENGYKVGPSDSAEYSTNTSKNSIKTDAGIDPMYYPGNNYYYWLASPSSNYHNYALGVKGEDGGCMSSFTVAYNAYLSFCPLVSLKSDVKLELK